MNATADVRNALASQRKSKPFSFGTEKVDERFAVSIPGDIFTKQVGNRLETTMKLARDMGRDDRIRGIPQRVSGRQRFRIGDVDDLLEVNGIGERTLEKLRPYVYAG